MTKHTDSIMAPSGIGWLMYRWVGHSTRRYEDGIVVYTYTQGLAGIIHPPRTKYFVFDGRTGWRNDGESDTLFLWTEARSPGWAANRYRKGERSDHHARRLAHRHKR